MKTGKSITVVLTGLSLAFALSFGALAHSSFIWETDWRPFHVLPFTFTLSVAAEYAALTFIARVEQPWKTLAIVLIGNILAYGAACLYYFWSNDDEFPGHAWPPYMIGWVFCVVSFTFEVLIEPEMLKKDTKAGYMRLIWTLLITNIVTGGASALAERLICAGHWGA